MTALNNEIFLIGELINNGGMIHAKLNINKESTIFNGHFPGQPVVPGASMLQIIKDILERVLETSLLLKRADHLKFINIIVPGNNEPVTLDISYKKSEGQSIKAIGKISIATTVCFKFQGEFRML